MQQVIDIDDNIFIILIIFVLLLLTAVKVSYCVHSGHARVFFLTKLNKVLIS